MVLAGCRSDTLICLELLLYSDGETSWSWNSGRGDGSWHSGYADWKNVSSRPSQMRLWMCTTCGHYNSSKAACSQCGLRRSWVEVVQGVQQTNSATPPSLPSEEIKALEAALAAPPDNFDLCGKVRAPLEERLQHARKKKGARQLGSTSRRMSRRPSTRFQGKAGCDCTVTSGTRGVRRSRSGRISYSRRTSSRSRHFRKPPSQHAHRPHPAKQHHSALR